MGTNNTPGSLGSVPEKSKSDENERELNVSQDVVVVIVISLKRFRIHPGKNTIDIKKRPPGEQQGKIHIASPHAFRHVANRGANQEPR